MVCHQCERAVEPGQRFCSGCGASLRGVTDTTEVVPVVGDVVGNVVGDVVGAVVVDEVVDEWDTPDPIWAPTGSIPIQPSIATDSLPVTQPITPITPTAPIRPMIENTGGENEATPLYDFTLDEHTPSGLPSTTAEMPIMPVPAAQQRRFHFGLVTLISIVTALVTLVSLFAKVLSISSDIRLTPGASTPPAFRTGSWIVDDLADNLSIAGLIAALLMVIGGIGSAFRWRWGSGLAGGGGVAFAGIAALTLGLAQFPIDAAHEFALIPSEQPFVITITRDLGYWLLVAAGALGVVLFFASINDAVGDRRSGLNPWFAALGALASVVVAAGPLLPENLANPSDNWYLDEAPGGAPALMLVARLAQLGLLVFTGVIGFLLVRRYGLGLAIGGALPTLWLAVSTQFDITDNPIGPGFRNPGADDMHLHGVTIIGVSALIAMMILAVIAAYDQGIRDRR